MTNLFLYLVFAVLALGALTLHFSTPFEKFFLRGFTGVASLVSFVCAFIHGKLAFFEVAQSQRMEPIAAIMGITVIAVIVGVSFGDVAHRVLNRVRD